MILLFSTQSPLSWDKASLSIFTRLSRFFGNYASRPFGINFVFCSSGRRTESRWSLKWKLHRDEFQFKRRSFSGLEKDRNSRCCFWTNRFHLLQGPSPVPTLLLLVSASLFGEWTTRDIFVFVSPKDLKNSLRIESGGGWPSGTSLDVFALKCWLLIEDVERFFGRVWAS